MTLLLTRASVNPDFVAALGRWHVVRSQRHLGRRGRQRIPGRQELAQTVQTSPWVDVGIVNAETAVADSVPVPEAVPLSE